MAETSQCYDVIVVGASVSGATVAALLAAGGNSVALLEAEALSDIPPAASLLNPECGAILDTVGLNQSAVGAAEQTSYRFHLADFSKTITPKKPKDTVHVVEHATLITRMIEQAAAHPGFTAEAGQRVLRMVAGERVMACHLENGRIVEGRLAVLATGAGCPLAEQLSICSGIREAGVYAARYRCPGGDLGRLGHTDCILGLGGGDGVGYRLTTGETLTVAVGVRDSGARAINELMQISAHMVAAGLLPADWQTHAAGTRAQWSPAGGALEIENHVGKLTVAIGGVGGFVAGFTNETVYPGMWSAQLAANVISEALLCSQPQDKLRDFDREWRMTMAEYLRPPNTDAQSLLPLIFSNQQMADKMLESLVLGTNF